MRKNGLLIDLFVTIGLVVFASLITLAFKASFLVSTILFFTVPSVYLIIRKTPSLRRILFASFLFGFLLMQLDFIAEFNRAWVVPKLFFSQRVFGVMSIDVIIWGFLWAFVILVFYEHFLDKDRGEDKISKNFKKLFIFSLFTFAVVLLKFFFDKDKLYLPFTYLIMASLAALLFALVMLKIKKPGVLLHKFVWASLFFAFLHLAHELTALKVGQWYFPGQYLANMNVAGITFPLEEFFFWVLISTAVVLSYYEFFVDDEK